MITVREIWKLALPINTELVSGDVGVGREVSWVTSLRPRPPAFDNLKGGEIALVSISALRMLDERVTLAELINRLASMSVSAIVVSGSRPDDAAISASQFHGMPLFSLPKDVSPNEVERKIARLLAERRSDMYARSQELNRELMEMAIEGKGIATIVCALTQVSGRVAIVEDDEFLLRYYDAPEEFPVLQGEILPLLEASRASIADWMKGLALSSSDPPTETFSLPALGLARIVTPVATRDSVMAYLSLIGPEEDLTEMDRLTASRGAAALAVELARERAVLDAQDKMQESLVDALLSGSYPGEEAILNRAKRLGHDLRAQHAVLVFRLHGRKAPLEPSPCGNGRDNRVRCEFEDTLQRELRRRDVEALLRIKGESVALLYPVVPNTDERRLKDLVEGLRTDLSSSLGTQASVGIGRLHQGLDGLRIAYREAEQAVSLGVRLFGRGSATYFGDLGLYRLLLSIQDSPELRTFYLEVLGRLLEYDRKNGSELIKTLDAFFTSCGSPSEAAQRLHLHRNTLLYRIRRIREISGLNLDDPETRLSLHLALRIGQALAASRAAQPQKL